MKRALVSWSGGKDSCFALQKSVANNTKPVALVSVMNEQGNFSKSNGVPKEILSIQAKNLNLPIVYVSTNWKNYESDLLQALIDSRSKYKAEFCIFGDVDIEAHKIFEEMISEKAGLKAMLPLWEYSRKELAHEAVKSGIKAKISVIRKSVMPEKFLGIDYTEKLFQELSSLDIDLLGENGEFHTLVYDTPLFKNKIVIEKINSYEIQDCKLAIFKIV